MAETKWSNKVSTENYNVQNIRYTVQLISLLLYLKQGICAIVPVQAGSWRKAKIPYSNLKEALVSPDISKFHLEIEKNEFLGFSAYMCVVHTVCYTIMPIDIHVNRNGSLSDS